MAHSFTELKRLWPMWLDGLVFCDCSFHSVCPLMEKGKRLIWRERLPEGETGSCSDEWGHAQCIFNPIFWWWVACTPSLLSDLRPNIPVEQLQILKYYTVKVLPSTCQQIWKTLQWPQDWERSAFIPIPEKGSAKECSNYCTIVLISHASKVKLKLLQARLQ